MWSSDQGSNQGSNEDGRDARQLAAGAVPDAPAVLAAPLALDATPDAVADAAAEGEAPAEEPRYLFFRCGGAECVVPLAALREVLPQCPTALPLPHSPEWLLGVFALRAELVGLADPAPLLLGMEADGASGRYGAALLVGTGERVLAWAVESIGASSPFMPGTGAGAGTASEHDDATAEAHGATDDPRVAEPPVAVPYAAGTIALDGDRRSTVIHAEALLADMLRALEERPATP